MLIAAVCCGNNYEPLECELRYQVLYYSPRAQYDDSERCMLHKIICEIGRYVSRVGSHSRMLFFCPNASQITVSIHTAVVAGAVVHIKPGLKPGIYGLATSTECTRQQRIIV